MKYIIEALLMLCTICACSQQQVQREIINEVESAQLFARDSIIGYSNDPRMDEISGLVTSGTNPGLFWVHNDGGDEPLVYLINRQMEVQMVVKLTNAVQYREAHAEIDKVSNIDWEDITRM